MRNIMRNLSYSFAPNGTYFVFDVISGRTIKKDIPDHKQARMQWTILRGMDK